MTIQQIYDEFITKYDECGLLLRDSTILYQNNVQYDSHVYSDKMYGAIVEYCFMQLFLTWENFLEQSFKLYLCGSTDLKGVTYIKYGIPNNSEHAYCMLKGTKQYPDWTNLNEINTLSNIYFHESGPYALLASNPVELQQTKTIRNRISHISQKSVIAFNRLLAQTIIQTTNISVSDFLMTFKQGSETYYTYYTDILKSYVEAICNK